MRKGSRELGGVTQLWLCAIAIRTQFQSEQMRLSTAKAETPNSERYRVRHAQERNSCVDVCAHKPYRVDNGHREGDEKENCERN